MRAIAVVSVTVALLAMAGCKKADEAAKPSEPAAAPAAAADAGTPADLPKRKAGLWEQTITVAGAPPISTRVCIDNATDAKLWAQSQAVPNGQCGPTSTVKSADGGYVLSSTCTLEGGGSVKSTSKASGDFAANYAIDITAEISGAPNAAMNRTSAGKAVARWVGPCPSGWMGGDVELPGGTRMNNVAAIEGAK